MRLMSKICCSLSFVLALFFSSSFAIAQNMGSETTERLTAVKRSAIVAKIAEIFNEYYPLADVAADMKKDLEQKHKKGHYDRFTDIAAFTAQLTSDLRGLNNDQHIKVWPYEKIPDDLLAEKKLGSPDDNYGFRKVVLLPGNIGYIELTTFYNPEHAAPTAIAAMNFVAHCQVLIIDLRLNGGGDMVMANFLSSYFFEQSTHLTDVYTRKENKTEQIWTQNWVPGPRLANVPLYILLSRFSYSAAEDFSYQLQQLGRAVIIGQQTRGGAHSVRYMSFPELSINLKVPYTRDINPYSKTTYSGGVIPDVVVPTRDACLVAHSEAAKKLLQTETSKEKRYKLEWVLSGNQVDLEPVVLDDAKLPEYVGVYGDVHVTLEYGRLFYQRKNKTKFELIPMNHDLFKYRDKRDSHYRLQFSRDEQGHVIELYEHDSDGDTYPVQKRR
ncbi:S41 family peptidase [candidate division CSSED10-310 bacterium]|uniref:S41 family peptidase n=1 Tax=candidate division CSSED10-310 bacterium TaxID=2855610 RepID=A0ABV6Z1P8_UNCC1